jgi:hypothetical protein
VAPDFEEMHTQSCVGCPVPGHPSSAQQIVSGSADSEHVGFDAGAGPFLNAEQWHSPSDRPQDSLRLVSSSLAEHATAIEATTASKSARFIMTATTEHEACHPAFHADSRC